MSILSCSGISLAYGTDVILEDVGFTLNEGARLGIIGVNGAGKSTLLKIISGALRPDSGNVSIAKGARLGTLEQYTDSSFLGKTVADVALEKFSSLREMEAELLSLEACLDNGDEDIIKRYTALRDRFEILGGYEYKSKAISTVKRFGFSDEDMNKAADSLSGGQKTRLSLAALLLSKPDIVLLDEPTNHLDIEATRWLEEQIRASASTFIIVSHDRYFLDRTTTDTLEIENTHSTLYKGSYSQFKEKKKKLREDYEKHYKLQQKEIARLEAFIENQRKWNRERNIIAAESRMKAIERMDKLEKPENAPSAINIRINSASKSSSDVLSVRNLSKSFGGKVLFSSLSFELKKADRLFVIGGNGTGKSTLLKLINGVIEPDGGVSELGYNQQPGYYDQEQMLLNDGVNVITELWDAHPGMTQTELRSSLACYGFRGDDVFKSVSDLSGGERARLAIAKLVLSGAGLLILDEPTNYLDIQSKEVLEDALKNYGGTLICVSHDRYLVSSLATRILEIDPSLKDGYKLYDCGYEEYLRRRVSTEPAVKRERAVTDGAKDYCARKKEKSEKRREEKRKEFLTSETERLEKRISEIECEMEENPTDYVLLQKLDEEKSALDGKLLEYLDELLSFMD